MSFAPSGARPCTRPRRRRSPRISSPGSSSWHVQELALGGLEAETAKLLDGLARGGQPEANRPRRLKPGTVLVREYHGERHTITIVPGGYLWREATYASLSIVAL